MRVIRRIFATLVWLQLWLIVVSAELHAQDKATGAPRTVGESETGILVLQDGGVLEGQITRAADWYVVSRAGGQMQIEQARVMLVGHSLEEAYVFRRQQLNEAKAEPHLALADWCLRYNLLADADHELADARRLDPDHPRLALLERRLASANLPPTPKVRTPSPAKSESRNSSPAPARPTTTGDLHDGVVEMFTRKVQPVLVNNCTTSACHQLGGSQPFQLDRAILRGEANRRSTMHNLEATLALVDREHPGQSPLLTIPRRTHAGMAGPIFGPRQDAAFKHLADWVDLVVPPQPVPTDSAAPSDTATAEATSHDAGQPSPIAQQTKPVAKGVYGLGAKQAAAINPSAKVPPTQSHPEMPPEPAKTAEGIDDAAPQSLRTPHRLQIGARIQSWQPRDAFDAEIFNRQQQARSRTPSAAAQPIAGEKR
jgi:hypothetical protein